MVTGYWKAVLQITVVTNSQRKHIFIGHFGKELSFGSKTAVKIQAKIRHTNYFTFFLRIEKNVFLLWSGLHPILQLCDAAQQWTSRCMRSGIFKAQWQIGSETWNFFWVFFPVFLSAQKRDQIFRCVLMRKCRRWTGHKIFTPRPRMEFLPQASHLTFLLVWKVQPSESSYHQPFENRRTSTPMESAFLPFAQIHSGLFCRFHAPGKKTPKEYKKMHAS